MQALVAPVMDFIVALAGSAAKDLQASGVLRLLRLAQSLVEAMQQQACQAAAKQVEIMMDPESAVGTLWYSSVDLAVTGVICTVQPCHAGRCVSALCGELVSN